MNVRSVILCSLVPVCTAGCLLRSVHPLVTEESAMFAPELEIRGGLAHFVARDHAGRVITWGGNDSGQIGNGKPASWSDAYADQPVMLATGWKAAAVCAGGILARPDGRPYLRPSTFVDSGTSCARTPNGEVYCWGEPDIDYEPKRVQLPK